MLRRDKGGSCCWLVETRLLINTYNFWQQLTIFYQCSADVTLNPQAQVNLFGLVVRSWVMLQIVSNRKFFLKWPLSQELNCIKLLFKKWVHCITVMVKTYCKIIDKSFYKTMKIDLLESNFHTGSTASKRDAKMKFTFNHFSITIF